DVVVGVGLDGRSDFRWDTGEIIETLRKVAGDRPFIQWNKAYSENYKRDLWALTHMNSVQVIPPNAMEKAIPAFRRGNILINCFRLGVIFILDRQTKKVVWTQQLPNEGELWHGAHTVKVQPNGHLIYLFNINGRSNQDFYSSIEEMDPLTRKSVWSYATEPKAAFKIDSQGSVYRLANGNTLVTHHTSGGAAFEVTPQGRIVWEWLNPNVDANGRPTPVYRV